MLNFTINMTTICHGLSSNKKPCTYRVKLPNKYCRYHKSQESKERSKKRSKEKIKEEKKEENIDIIVNDINKEACSICLCDVEEEDDCHLVCNHSHHKECVNKLLKAECPVCRGPLKFKKITNININKIKNNEIKETMEQKLKTFKEDQRMALELEREINRNERNREDRNREERNREDRENRENREERNREEDLIVRNNYINRILEESILSAAIDEENLINSAIQASIEFERERIESETIYETIDRLCQGNNCVTIKLI
jgi:hypothetical protein